MSIVLTFVCQVWAVDDPRHVMVHCQKILTTPGRAPEAAKATFGWREALSQLKIYGIKFDGTDLFIATTLSQGQMVESFFDENAVPKFLKTSDYLTLSETVAEIQNEINLQNLPVKVSGETLHWLRITEHVPEELINFMNKKFDDGTNCFRIVLKFNHLSSALGFLSDKVFQGTLESDFAPNELGNSDIGVIYKEGLPIHAYLPIGNTGWVLTKNGTGSKQPLRFMRESELISYYRTVKDRTELDQRMVRFSWEEAPSSPIFVRYFNKIR